MLNIVILQIFEQQHDKSNKMTLCAKWRQISLRSHAAWSESAVHMKKPRVIRYPLRAQWRLGSDCEDAQVDLSLCWVHVILLVLSCCISFSYYLKALCFRSNFIYFTSRVFSLITVYTFSLSFLDCGPQPLGFGEMSGLPDAFGAELLEV